VAQTTQKENASHPILRAQPQIQAKKTGPILANLPPKRILLPTRCALPPREPWSQDPEWFDDVRTEPRWLDVLTLAARFGEAECLGKTRDLSLGGLGAVLHGVSPAPGDPIEVDVLFEGEVREFHGEVVHAAPRDGGTRVGVRLRALDLALRRFLEFRYGAEPTGAGRVT